MLGGGGGGERVWQEEYVFSVDRYSVFCLIQNLCQFIKLLSIELFSGCCFDLFVTCSVQINEL